MLVCNLCQRPSSLSLSEFSDIAHCTNKRSVVIIASSPFWAMAQIKHRLFPPNDPKISFWLFLPWSLLSPSSCPASYHCFSPSPTVKTKRTSCKKQPALGRWLFRTLLPCRPCSSPHATGGLYFLCVTKVKRKEPSVGSAFFATTWLAPET